MSRVRIAFFGTPEFAVASLAMLLEDEHFEVVGVVTQPDRPAGRNLKLQPSAVKQLCLQHRLNCISPENVNEHSVLKEIDSWRAESGVVVAFGQILSRPLLDLFPKQMVNVHASILPRWRGAAPIQRTIEAGDAEAGVALQVLVDKLDAGPVLGYKKIIVTDDMDAMSLHNQLADMGSGLLHVEYMDYLRGNLLPTQQDESLVTYAKKIKKSEAQINWQRPARELFNRMRGFVLGPGVWTFCQGKKLKIHKALAVDSAVNKNQAGVIIDVRSESFVVATGNGALEIFQVQPESRGKMSAGEFLRGHQLKVGDKLGEG